MLHLTSRVPVAGFRRGTSQIEETHYLDPSVGKGRRLSIQRAAVGAERLQYDEGSSRKVKTTQAKDRQCTAPKMPVCSALDEV
jgi:hypothetical protein